VKLISSEIPFQRLWNVDAPQGFSLLVPYMFNALESRAVVEASRLQGIVVISARDFTDAASPYLVGRAKHRSNGGLSVLLGRCLSGRVKIP
jgi:hypothetical protein